MAMIRAVHGSVVFDVASQAAVGPWSWSSSAAKLSVTGVGNCPILGILDIT